MLNYIIYKYLHVCMCVREPAAWFHCIVACMGKVYPFNLVSCVHVVKGRRVLDRSQFVCEGEGGDCNFV